MKNLTLAFFGLVFTLSAFGVVGEDAPTVVKVEQIHTAHLLDIDAHPATEDSAVLVMKVQYSNSCIASSKTIAPKMIRQFVGDSSDERISVLAESKTTSKRFCPMIHRPVVVTYETTIDNMQSGSKYTFKIVGRDNLRTSIVMP